MHIFYLNTGFTLLANEQPRKYSSKSWISESIDNGIFVVFCYVKCYFNISFLSVHFNKVTTNFRGTTMLEASGDNKWKGTTFST